ncbi:hypothetical protein [Streptomyces sp. NPDC012510]|uniref:hypothetical protein n=1 Tax=Streptomyces sp. NPDC012510 TaxID=3364838 RepID=UPI0036E03A71
MAAERGAVLRPGDWITYGDGDHQVVALAGTAVRLRSQSGAESVVLASHLMAAPDFSVTGTEPLPALEPSGLLTALPEAVPTAAKEWQYARRLAAEAGLDDTNETADARVLDGLLTRAEHGPDTRSAKVAARTRTARAAPAPAAAPETEGSTQPETGLQPPAAAEARRASP